MSRLPSFDPRGLGRIFVVVGLATAVTASAGSESGNGGACSGPPAEPDIAVLATTSQEPPGETPAASVPSPLTRFRGGERHPPDRPLPGLLPGSGAKGGIRLTAEPVAHAPQRRPSLAPDGARTGKGFATRRPSSGGGDSRAARPHRMPSPEIL